MYAELIDHMGTDLSVVNAARVSFDKVSEWDCYCHMPKGVPTICDFHAKDGCGVLKEADAKLIQYLAKHDHWTPFAHTAISLRMKAPVPIRTQCFKHKAGLVENEESRRYIKSTPEVYYPEVWRKAAASVKQGSSDEPVDLKPLEVWDWSGCGEDWGYKETVEWCLRFYEHMLDQGVCPEQARFVLPQGCMVNWVWTGNLYSFANFFNKRTEAHAQREVQELAHKVGELIEPLFPVSWKALTSGN